MLLGVSRREFVSQKPTLNPWETNACKETGGVSLALRNS